jgi:hypothetical protein
MQARPGSIIVTFELLPAEEDVSFTEDLLDTLVTAVRPFLPCPYANPNCYQLYGRCAPVRRPSVRRRDVLLDGGHHILAVVHLRGRDGGAGHVTVVNGGRRTFTVRLKVGQQH